MLGASDALSAKGERRTNHSKKSYVRLSKRLAFYCDKEDKAYESISVVSAALPLPYVVRRTVFGRGLRALGTL